MPKNTAKVLNDSIADNPNLLEIDRGVSLCSFEDLGD